MSNSVLSINIRPDTKIIEIFNNNFTIPNETFTISGTIEVHLTRPMQIRQIYVDFRGEITSILSSLDYLRDKSNNSPSYGDEIPLEKWETNDNNISIMDKVARKAFGYSSVRQTIIKEHVYLVDELFDLQAGTTAWPFSVTIRNVYQLPPSLILPFHQIQYYISANVKLKNRLSDRLKVSYWNTRMKLPSSSNDAREETLNTDENDATDIPLLSTKVKHYTLGAEHPIVLKQYSYPSISSHRSTPRIRFRGARKDFLKYEVSMPKFVCLQKKAFSFICNFSHLTPEAIIESIDAYLIQIELYPIRAGNYTKISKFAIEEVMVPRNREFCRTTYTIPNYVYGSDTRLKMKLDLPHISPSIDADILKISHKIRLAISFKNDTKNRTMNLSFPLVIGSVPVERQSTSPNFPEIISIEHTPVRIRQNLDQWILTDNQYNMVSYEDFEKLPTYRDVLREGNPPSPFPENAI